MILLDLFLVIRQYTAMDMQFSLSGISKVSHSITIYIGEFSYFAFA